MTCGYGIDAIDAARGWHPVALGRLAYRADTRTVIYQSDKASGPTAGAERVEALEFLARVVSHIPNKGQVLQRYYGWYANRTRGLRRQAGVPAPAPPVAASSATARVSAYMISRNARFALAWSPVGTFAIL